MRLTTRTPLILALAALLLPAGASAQSGDPETEAPPTIYDSEGRRDPFRPTIGDDKGSGDKCALREGMAGVLLQEVKLTGVMQTARGPMAMWEGGTANQGYFSYEGDQFCDGTVHAIDTVTKCITVRQVKEDPNRKLLRPWIDVQRCLYPEAGEGDDSGGPGAFSGIGEGGGRRGPGNIARPNTAARPGTMIKHRQ